MKLDETERSWPGLSPDHRRLLAQIPSGASLSQEIAFVRARIRKLAESYGPKKQLDREEAERQQKIDRQITRMLELLTRMVNVQGRMTEENEDPVTEAADQVRQGLEKAGLPPDRTPKGRARKNSREPDASQK